jgi:hypothetical protein
VYEKYTTNRTLSTPKKKWVDVALFNVLQLFIEPATRQSLDPAKINTSSGVALWKLLKEKALGDLTVNREQAHKRLITTTIRPGQLYMEFIEHVQRNVYFCRQAGDKISEDKLVRYIITGLRGAEHLTHVSALLAMQMQGKKLTVRQIEKYFRKVSPSTNTQNIRTTYGRSNNIYAAPVSHSEDENAVLSHTEDDASTSTDNNTTSNSTSDDHNNINNNRMRNTLRDNGRGQPGAENSRSNEPTVQRNGFVPARNTHNKNVHCNTLQLPRCEHCGLELGQIHQGNNNNNTLPQYANHITHVPPDQDVCTIDDDTANMVLAAYASVTENK